VDEYEATAYLDDAADGERETIDAEAEPQRSAVV
jgi:hypothetical protein